MLCSFSLQAMSDDVSVTHGDQCYHAGESHKHVQSYTQTFRE
jgi:hypothetical protein